MTSGPGKEPSWVSRIAVEAAHDLQIQEHGGQPGLRDEGLLESALARPKNRFYYEGAAELSALAAAYGFGLVKNHPFIDGNKRIAFVAMNMFLILNGHEIEAPEPEVVQVVLAVADGSLNESGLADWVREVLVRLQE